MPFADVVEDLDGVLDELSEEAEHIGIEIEVQLTENSEGEDVLWLSSIERVSGKRGSGAVILERLSEIAADHEISIEGQISEPVGSLSSYYRNQGFEIEVRDGRTIIVKHP
tara:strand:+ start:4395 stop:4727 length:333 start_codon:yes stop_codon:yes gene_type:complete